MALTAEQLQARSEALGGTDCAVVLGLSKWKTARQLFHEKRGEIALDADETDEQWFGRAIEPAVRQWYANKTGRLILQPTGTMKSARYPFMVAHIDGYSDRPTVRGYEGKSAMRSLGWGAEGTDNIPSDAFFQVQHYMIVTEIPVFDVVCLVGRKPVTYEVHADNALLDYIIKAETEFMDRVANNDPPPLDYQHRTSLDVINKIYPGTDGSKMMATAEAIQWRMEMLDATQLEGEAKKAKEGFKARLLEVMGNAAFMEFPDGKMLRRKQITRPGFSVGSTTYMDLALVNSPNSSQRARRPRSGVLRK